MFSALPFPGLALAQSQSCAISGTVLSDAGTGIAGAAVTGGASATYTGPAGLFVLAYPCGSASTVELTASAPRMHSERVTVDAGAQGVSLLLRSNTIEQSASVTATRSMVELGPVAGTTTTLSAADLTQYPALTLDERLRQHAGFELFRRSSTWVANPTSEGISLRGLGSTAASRTLVLESGVPLNDPFGGWIHWDEMAPETIAAVTLASGGGSDLYGSSALGSVIDIVPLPPGPTRATADLAKASEDTTDLSARADARESKWDESVASQLFRTGGYILVAPAARGAVDTPANVHFENGHMEVSRSLGPSSVSDSRVFLVGKRSERGSRQRHPNPEQWHTVVALPRGCRLDRRFMAQRKGTRLLQRRSLSAELFDHPVPAWSSAFL